MQVLKLKLYKYIAFLKSAAIVLAMKSISFPDALRSSMNKKKMTGRKLSKTAKLSEHTISKILNGLAWPRNDNLKAIIKAVAPDDVQEAETLLKLGQKPNRKELERIGVTNAVIRLLSQKGFEIARAEDEADESLLVDFFIVIHESKIPVHVEIDVSDQPYNAHALLGYLMRAMKHHNSDTAFICTQIIDEKNTEGFRADAAEFGVHLVTPNELICKGRLQPPFVETLRPS